MKPRASLRFAAAIGFAAALVVGAGHAAMYKWVDENGRAVYGDTPPAGVKAERMATGVAPGDPAAVREMATKDAEIKKRMQQRTEDEAKVNKDRVDQNLARSQCQQAVGRIKSLREDTNVYRFNERGEKVFFKPAERDTAIAQNQKIMRDLGCTPAIQP